ncbi:HEXXH motif-containing putative peptide modification protein [Nonomuraea sp. NBC_01738]|uniref:aKG-HExxH-type peptide beta-hydroxylase n=1 Tax=Nonomuraea sp. NBC_01738 TaxID=2976003 RepID=UPI002E0D2082|nr:HEXXH motif-containing putative peptide modification protein [Nonomuraea sp. NBC_01738]
MSSGIWLSPAELADLARGAAQPAVLGRLAATERSRNVLLIREVVRRCAALSHPAAQRVSASYRLLARLQRTHPAQVATALRYPLLGTWAADTLTALSAGDDRARPERLSAAAATALFHAARTSAPPPAGSDAPVLPKVPFSAEAGAVALPGLGRLVVAVGEGEEVVAAPPYLLVGGSRVRVPADGRWEGVRDVGILLDDVDAWRFPGPVAPLGRLSDAAAAGWGSVIAAGKALLAARHPGAARTFAAMTSVAVPLSAPEDGTRSATSRTAYGSIALSRPPSPTAAAVTLAHEVRHAVLAALMDLFDLVRPNSGELFYAPWRDDPRPAAALLQGAYAHMGVAGFWRVERHAAQDPEVGHAEFARWRDAAYQAVHALLDSGALTAIGRHFVDGMLDTLTAWRADRVPSAAHELAERAAQSHRQRWVLRNRR